MLTKIIEFSVRNKLIIGLFVIFLLGYGSYQATQLPIDAVPDITDNQVLVITVAPSYGALDIERLVTFPIEQATSNIPGMKQIRSFSRFGLSLVTIVFSDETDVYWARQQVAERLVQVQRDIPPGIGAPTLGPISSGLGEIYQYMVKPKKGYEQKYTSTELRTIQDWVVRRQLLGVQGVAEVSSFGGKLKQFEIAIHPNKINAHGVTITEVFDAIAQNNTNTGGAYIEKGPTVLYIRSEGLIASAADLENIAIPRKNGGLPLFIKDIAEVKIGHATRYGAMCYNDQGEVAGAIVMMLKGANSSAVIENVKERIAQIQKTLPEGIEIEPFLDRTKMVNNAINTVKTNLLEGALIVVFILVIFLGNLRAGLLVASVIPLAMLFAISMMNAFGVSGNLMSLGALDFGLIVDGAVIIVEAVLHQLGIHGRMKHKSLLTSQEMDSQVIHSAGKMMNSAVFGQIIILVVYIPIFTLQGIEGKMFKPMAQTVAFALLGAFILSLTYIPMMSALVLSKKAHHSKNLSDRVMQRIENGYKNLLINVLRYPKLVLGAVLGLFVAAMFVLNTLGGEFIPSLEEGDFAVDTRVLTGSNLTTTIKSTQQAAHILVTRFPEVLKVVTKIGSGEVPTDPMPMEASDMMVILKDKKEWTSAKTFDELAEKMGKELEDVPGITAGFQYPVQMRFNELMTGAKQDVVCKIFGENMDTLAVLAAQLGQIIGTIEGAENLYIEPITGVPQVVIAYNRPMIAQYHLSIEEINRVVNVAFAGQSAGQLFDEEKRFDLVVRLDASERKNLEDIQNLLIPTPSGISIPLSQLADVSIKDGPNQIQREDAKRRIVVGLNVKNRDVQSIVEELKLKVDQSIKFPTGTYITYGGAFENLEQAQKRLKIAVPISLLLIFVLLFYAFSSVKHGLLIYSAIPLSAIGGIFFLALRGMPFSISAGVGFIALFGVAVLNGIVLIAEFNRLKLGGMNQLPMIVQRGATSRLRPVLMTAFVASFGFLPMAISNGAGAEVQRPLATVVIGGLLVATFLTLFVLPLLYVIFEKTAKSKGKSIKISVMLGFMVAAQINHTHAQIHLSLDDAIRIARQNNLEIKDEQRKAEYAKALIATYKNLPPTAVAVEVGQINSALTDTKFSISQSISFPAVYKKQKAVLEEEWIAADLQAVSKAYEVEIAVTKNFYEHYYLQQKEFLLLQTYKLFDNFAEKANLRYNKGESNILEKTTAESQKLQVSTQLQQIQNELKINDLAREMLLQQPSADQPELRAFRFPLVLTLDSTVALSHPSLLTLQQQRKIADAKIALDKTALLPNIGLGYYNNSFRGTGADDKVYGAGSRFHSVQVFMEIPLMRRNQHAHIAASKLQATAVTAQYETARLQLVMQREKLRTEYQSKAAIVENYTQNGLAQAQTIEQTAQKQYNSGEINYLEYVMLLHQAILLRSEHIEAIHSLNQTAILLHYLSK